LASFTEQATLILKDRSSANVNKINRSLAKLLATTKRLKSAGGTVRLRVNAGDLTRAHTSATKLSASLRGINSRSTVVKVNSSQITTAQRRATRLQNTLRNMPNANLGGGGAMGGGPGGVGGGRGGQGQNPKTGRFGSSFGAGRPFLAYEAYFGLRRGIGAGFGAIGDLQNQRSASAQAGFTGDKLKEIESAAEGATRGLLSVTKASSFAVARNLATAGANGEILRKLAAVAARSESSLAIAFDPATASRVMESAVKITDLGGGLENAQRGKDILEAVTAAKIRGGPDFDVKSYLSAVRISGLSATLNKEGFLALAEMTDELGRVSGSGLARLSQVLTGTSGVNKKTIASLTRAGLRDSKGIVLQGENDIRTDPAAWARENLVPLVDAGIKKANNLSAEALQLMKDNDPAQYGLAVSKELAKLGLTKNDMRTAAQLVTKADQMEQNVRRSSSLNFNQERELAAGNFGRSLDLLGTQMLNLIAVGVDPLAKALAGVPLFLADAVNKIANDPVLLGITQAGGAAALGAGAYFGGKMLLGWATAGPRLSIAATQLSAAAMALQGAAGVSGGMNGSGRANRGGRAGSGLTRNLGKLAGIGLVGAALYQFSSEMSDVKGGATAAKDAAFGLVGSLGGGLLGAKIGAAAGSFFGPLGSGIGSVILGAVGFAFGPDLLNSTLDLIRPSIDSSFRKLTDGLGDAIGNSARWSFNSFGRSLGMIRKATKFLADGTVDGLNDLARGTERALGLNLPSGAPASRWRGRGSGGGTGSISSRMPTIGPIPVARPSSVVALPPEETKKSLLKIRDGSNNANRALNDLARGINNVRAPLAFSVASENFISDVVTNLQRTVVPIPVPRPLDGLQLAAATKAVVDQLAGQSSLPTDIFDPKQSIGQAAVQATLDIEAGGAKAGDAAADSLLERAAAIGTSIGDSAASVFSAAVANVRVTVNSFSGTPSPDTGATTTAQ